MAIIVHANAEPQWLLSLLQAPASQFLNCHGGEGNRPRLSALGLLLADGAGEGLPKVQELEPIFSFLAPDWVRYTPTCWIVWSARPASDFLYGLESAPPERPRRSHQYRVEAVAESTPAAAFFVGLRQNENIGGN
jgi:hypothetical protein